VASLTGFFDKLSQKRKHDFAALEVTYRCNLRCRTCGLRRDSHRGIEQELTTEEWFGVIDQLLGVGKRRFAIIGAEPLMRKDTPQIIEYIKRSGNSCILTTNGMLLTEETAKRIVQSGVDGITLSMDGPPDLHNSIRRGHTAHENLTQGIENLVRHRGRFGDRRKPQLRIHTTISSLNVKALHQVFRIAKGMNVDELHLNYISETSNESVTSAMFGGRAIANRRFVPEEGSLLLKPDEVKTLKETLSRMKKECNSFPIRATVISRLKERDFLHGVYPIKRCHIVRDRMVITPYGDVIPCSHFSYSYGSLRSESAREILSGEKRKMFISRLDKELFEVCRSCCYHQYNLSTFQYIKMGVGLNL